MPFATTEDGAEVYYKDWGPKDAQPILFHYCWPLSAGDWDRQMLLLFDKATSDRERPSRPRPLQPSQRRP